MASKELDVRVKVLIAHNGVVVVPVALSPTRSYAYKLPQKFVDWHLNQFILEKLQDKL